MSESQQALENDAAYSEEKRALPAIPFLMTSPVSQKTIQRILAGGFSLVLLLVMAAAWLGYRSSQAIQENAQALVREHVVNSERGANLERAIVMESREMLNQLAIILGTCLALAGAFSILTIWVTNRAYRQIQWQTEELTRVSWHMLQDHELVARRFSHEMHDELGQALTGLRSMVKRLDGPGFEVRRAEFLQILDEVLANVRELSQLLRPVILDDFGLPAGLRWLAERFTQRTAIDVHCIANLPDERLAESLETHLFRITQEALTNIARHSGATEAFINLSLKDSKILLLIQDNGSGLSSKRGSPGLGLTGMRARARQLGGDLTFSRSPTGGLQINVEVPRNQPEVHHAKENAHPVSR